MKAIWKSEIEIERVALKLHFFKQYLEKVNERDSRVDFKVWLESVSKLWWTNWMGSDVYVVPWLYLTQQEED